VTIHKKINITTIDFLLKNLRITFNMYVKKYRYQAIKQKEQSELKIQKTMHEIRRHK